jgi:hypothetical protein
VTSATYRQSSNARPELTDRDPYNRLLARQNRFRVEAEIVRDLALASSGLLSQTVGGPSVHPPQPEGVSDVTFDNQATWQESTGDDRYRRGLYTWFQRTSPYPGLVAFDAPDANLACTRRERSNTPLQALTLLNDVTFVECANALAEKMLKRFPASRSDQDVADQRIRLAFKRTLARDPSVHEVHVLVQLYRDSRSLSRWPRELKLTSLSKRPNNEDSSADASEREACRAVARALLNLDEFITRE